MNPQLQQLIFLQEVELEIQFLRKQLADTPKQIENSLSHLNKEKEELTDAQQKIKDLQKSRSRLEQDAASENDRMSKTKTKLPAVKTNKEYTAILAEIEVSKKKVSEIEDVELEIMEELEAKESKIPKFESTFREEEKKFQEFKKQKEENAEVVKKNIAELEVKLNGIFKDIDPKWTAHYKKILTARGGLAVVSINNTACLGCNQQILLQISIEVKMGKKIHLCQHCSRILYFIPEEETEPAVSE
jgi:predicted  nucleic acid-binding Zn-ribbon protein